MRLDEYANAESLRLEHPDKAWQPSVSGTANEAVVVTKPLTGNPDHDEVMRQNGYPPEEWELVGDMNFSRRMLVSGDEVTSYRFKVRKKLSSYDLPTLFTQAKKTRATAKKSTSSPDRATVVLWADPQTGKVGSRGGTPELITRVSEKIGKLESYIKEQKTTHAVFADIGDSIENFESTPQQRFTNDLSLMDQLDVEATLEQSVIEVLAQTHSDVKVVGVGSNHCAWRQGKGNLGKPSDDWGLFIKRQLKKAFELNPSAYSHVSFYEPDEWSDSVTIDVLGTGLGLVHGHQVSRPEAIPTFWAGHTHGAQPLAYADILVTGHFHCLRLQPTGRSMRTGRSKWWIQAPTLDNGSDWYKNLKGDDSDPGLAVFVIDAETGFDLQSFAIL